MLAKLNSSAAEGIEGYLIKIEVDLCEMGIPYFAMVGLPDQAVKEAKERISAALKNNGYTFPLGKIVINLAPAYKRKEGTNFDLALSIGVLISSSQIFPKVNLKEYLFLGEVSLDGELQPIKGILPMVINAREKGIKNIFVPFSNAKEAALVDDVNIFAANNIIEVARHITKNKPIPQFKNSSEISSVKYSNYNVDFQDVKGQENSKRALEIAAAGAHNLLMTGPPGSGKTMLAKRFPTILPDMTLAESLEVTKIYSVFGLLKHDTPLITERPFRNPHHTISQASFVGGGRIPMPGEVSLSHLGVLFLDELPEFQKSALETLRQPMEDRMVTISRVTASLTYPSSFILLASMNPCPCGYLGDSKHKCTCTESAIQKYKQKISGPLLDRIDLFANVPRQEYDKLNISSQKGEKSKDIRERVNKARQMQLKRYSGNKAYFNSMLTVKQIEECCKIGSEEEKIIKLAFERLNLSARGYHRILKLSRTIADLEESENIKVNHITEAMQYRNLDNITY